MGRIVVSLVVRDCVIPSQNVSFHTKQENYVLYAVCVDDSWIDFSHDFNWRVGQSKIRTEFERR